MRRSLTCRHPLLEPLCVDTDLVKTQDLKRTKSQELMRQSLTSGGSVCSFLTFWVQGCQLEIMVKDEVKTEQCCPDENRLTNLRVTCLSFYCCEDTVLQGTFSQVLSE